RQHLSAKLLAASRLAFRFVFPKRPSHRAAHLTASFRPVNHLVETAVFRAPHPDKPNCGPRILQHVSDASTTHQNRCFLRPNHSMNRAAGRASYSIIFDRQLLPNPLSSALPTGRTTCRWEPHIMRT
ncbi:hypothetical protein AB4084_30175, partial [Lysobacter sp. 2RAB21]